MIRFNKYPDKTVKGMAEEAIDLVLADAGVDRKDLQAAFFSNTFWGMFNLAIAVGSEKISRLMSSAFSAGRGLI